MEHQGGTVDAAVLLRKTISNMSRGHFKSEKGFRLSLGSKRSSVTSDKVHIGEPQSPLESTVSQFNLLRLLYPNFPVPMLKSIFVKESGSGFATHKILQEYGWTTVKVMAPLVPQLTKNTSDHLSVPYFWGMAKPSHKAALSRKGQPGSFLTVIHSDPVAGTNSLYAIWYLTAEREVVERVVGMPSVPDLIQKYLLLNEGFMRPNSIHQYDLLPFLWNK